MLPWNHGGDWAAYELEYGGAPLDFSATVSTAARATPSADRAAVSRPTMRPTAARARSRVPAVRAR